MIDKIVSFNSSELEIDVTTDELKLVVSADDNIEIVLDDMEVISECRPVPMCQLEVMQGKRSRVEGPDRI